MNNLNVLVPYRDREEQKAKFIDVMYEFLSNSHLESFRIYIIEQADDNEFNRGYLLNIGFLETSNEKSSYYCFNDLDLLPRSFKAKYFRPPSNSIIHPYGHRHSLGGKILIDAETFKKMNGFSTKYWVWGYEDDDFMLRAMFNGINVIRNNFSERYKSEIYYELDGQNTDITIKLSKISTHVNKILFYYTVINPNLIAEEGLNTTKYEVLSKDNFEKYTLIKCELKNHNQSIKHVHELGKYSSYLNSSKL